MALVNLKDEPELRRLVKAAFPDYRKKVASVTLFQGEANINSYWDGGTREEHALVEIKTGRRKALPTSHPFYDVVARGLADKSNDFVSINSGGGIKLKVLPAGFVLVTAGTFCGRPATATVTFGVGDVPEGIGKRLKADRSLLQIEGPQLTR